jgi:hypothetical protein
VWCAFLLAGRDTKTEKKKNRQASKSSTGWIRRLFFSISIFLLLFLFSIKALARKVGAN